MTDTSSSTHGPVLLLPSVRGREHLNRTSTHSVYYLFVNMFVTDLMLLLSTLVSVTFGTSSHVVPWTDSGPSEGPPSS